MEYGFQLNEFDSFFNFRATEYVVENGFSEYFEWHDDKTWYPTGRNVSHSSQFMLHVTTAITYQIFGGNLSLYDYTILFPAVIGSLTVVVIFGLVRLFGGTLAGLIASLLFAISLPILLRGSIGWFKSEPLGIFYGVLGLYLFLSAIKSKNKKIAFVKIISGAIVLSFAISSWGGNQFFIIPIGLFLLALPFVNKDHKFLLWGIPLFVGVFLLITGSFERPGPHFVFGLGGVVLGIPTIFLISSIFLHKITKGKNFVRNGLLFLLLIMIIGTSVLTINSILIENGESEFISIPSFRYLNAMNPFLTSSDPLVDSIAEHASTSIDYSFLFHSVWMIFAGIGIWLLLSKKNSENENLVKNDMKVFSLIIGITGIYVSSVFIRLEVFASISLIILASIGLSILTKFSFSEFFLDNKSHMPIPAKIIQTE
jgi:dolichyl-diphosphooligosaccharide--protein glycosyltransferase